MTRFFAYKPDDQGREPPHFNPDGSLNRDQIVFEGKRYSIAVRRAQRLLGPDVVVYAYEDFMDRSTWQRVTTPPLKTGTQRERPWWCVRLASGQGIKYQAVDETVAKRQAWRVFGADVTVYRCPDPADESTWVLVTWPGPEEDIK